jgi:hypothetical protein
MFSGQKPDLTAAQSSFTAKSLPAAQLLPICAETNRRGGWDAREALHDAERVGGGEPAGGFVEKQRGGDPQNESTWGLGRTRGSARC